LLPKPQNPTEIRFIYIYGKRHQAISYYQRKRRKRSIEYTSR